MELRLDGKTAVVTGGSRGIGRGCALTLGKAGANVVVNYANNKRAADEVVSIIKEAGGQATAFQADVADPLQVQGLVDAAVDQFGSLDVVISNVASSTRQSFLDTDLETLRRTLDVSFFGNFHVCQRAAQKMVERGTKGSIIVIGSLHAVYPLPQAFDYNVAKAAVHHMAMTMANELAPHQIRVNLLVPGWIDTPGERKWLDEEQLYRQAATLPWGRLGTPEEVGQVALFLASDAAAYVSGSTYYVDGALSVSMPSGGSSKARS